MVRSPEFDHRNTRVSDLEYAGNGSKTSTVAFPPDLRYGVPEVTLDEANVMLAMCESFLQYH